MSATPKFPLVSTLAPVRTRVVTDVQSKTKRGELHLCWPCNTNVTKYCMQVTLFGNYSGVEAVKAVNNGWQIAIYLGSPSAVIVFLSQQ